MKKFTVLSFFLLLTMSKNIFAAAQAVVTNNAQLNLIMACQGGMVFFQQTKEDADDQVAMKMLESMTGYIGIAQALASQIASAQNGYFVSGKPVTLEALQAQQAAIQSNIDKHNADIHALRQHGGGISHRGKIKNRHKALDDLKGQLDKTNTKLTAAQSAVALQNLASQNALAFEQVLEDYINQFGQVSGQAITSIYNTNIAITPTEYVAFVNILQQAQSQFGSMQPAMKIQLPNQSEVSLQQVATMVQAMSPQSASYANIIMAGIALAAATGIVLAGNQLAQGQSPTQIMQNFQGVIQNLASLAKDTFGTINGKWKAFLTNNPDITGSVKTAITGAASDFMKNSNVQSALAAGAHMYEGAGQVVGAAGTAIANNPGATAAVLGGTGAAAGAAWYALNQSGQPAQNQNQQNQ